jgi:hypothetical protein
VWGEFAHLSETWKSQFDTIGYDLCCHPAPIFEEENFLINPVNHWAPENMVSLMVLEIPSERTIEIPNRRQVAGTSDWWG